MYQKPDNYGAKNAEHLAPQAKTGRQYKEYGFWRESEESYQEAINKYNQLIHGVDYALGMIRKSLEELGLADNTIIIFTGDNGYSCGAHNFGGKVRITSYNVCYTQLLRVGQRFVSEQILGYNCLFQPKK